MYVEQLLFREAASRPNITMRFGWTVEDIAEDKDGVSLKARSADGAKKKGQFSYIVGCDGGRSTVRKLAAIDFEGFTYPERFIKIATSFDFGTANPKVAFRNYFSDPTEWCNLFKVQGKRPPGLWRAIMPIGPDETDEIALSPERIEERMQKFFPNSGRYEIEYVNVYGAHQCVAASFRKGRVLLAGDAAHVNNPIGGLGLNSGIHEAWDLAGLLDKVLRKEADASSLDQYEARRRPLNIEYVQEQTVANKKRLEEREPAQRAKRFDELRAMAADPARHKAFLMRASLLESARRARSLAQ
jgi:3-(3-hydroxy-phenyl)propionate hydroxylase